MADLVLMLVDLEEMKQFSKDQGALEANDLNHWDINFWSERLSESKYEINEVGSLSLPPSSLKCVLQFAIPMAFSIANA